MKAVADKIIFALNTGKHNEFQILCTTFKYHGFNEAMLKPVQGYYNGKVEHSYIFPWTEKSSRFIRNLTTEHKQESILYIDERLNAELYYLDDYVSIPIGTMCKTTAGTAQQQPGYTKVDGNYYTVFE